MPIISDLAPPRTWLIVVLSLLVGPDSFKQRNGIPKEMIARAVIPASAHVYDTPSRGLVVELATGEDERQKGLARYQRLVSARDQMVQDRPGATLELES